jgi:hypothetical protein
MNASSLTSVFDRWSRPSYERRVRGMDPPTYLWGSAGISQPIPFDKPLILHIRNDVLGETIAITTVAGGSQTTIGTILAGECVSIPVQGMTGVFATCALESVVGCLIRDAA